MRSQHPIKNANFEISIDTTRAKELGKSIAIAQEFASRAEDLLQALRKKHDLSHWEFTKQVRIAPMEIPHSHPVLTLNTRLLSNEDAFLSTYLHEQIHWGLSLHFNETIEAIVARIQQRYPGLHLGEPGEARNEFSTYLHIVVNWLEVLALSEFVGKERAEEIASQSHIYHKITDLVLNNWSEIETFLGEQRILPFPKAD